MVDVASLKLSSSGLNGASEGSASSERSSDLRRCSRCYTGLMISRYEDLVCHSCGNTIYDAFQSNSKRVESGLSGNVFNLPYVGEYESYRGKILAVKVMDPKRADESEGRYFQTKAMFIMDCPFLYCGERMSETHAPSGLSKRKARKYRCANGHIISVGLKLEGWR